MLNVAPFFYHVVIGQNGIVKESSCPYVQKANMDKFGAPPDEYFDFEFPTYEARSDFYTKHAELARQAAPSVRREMHLYVLKHPRWKASRPQDPDMPCPGV